MGSFARLRVGQFGARLPAGEAFAQYNGTWTHGSTRYRPVWNRTGDLSGFTANPKRGQFAKVTLAAGAPARGKTATLVAAPMTPGGSSFDLYPDTRSLPGAFTEYVLPGVRWRYSVSQDGGKDADGEPVWDAGQWVAKPRAYSAGKEYTERFNTGVFGPHLTGPLTDGEDRPGAVRMGDTFLAYLPLFSDGAGHIGDSRYSRARSTLYADGGTRVFAIDEPLNGVSYELPAAKRAFRLTTDVSRPTTLSSVSTRITAEWTFTSAHVTGVGQRLPLSVVRFTPRLSTASTAKAGTRFSVPFTVEGAATARTARKLAFSVSYDDGRTWHPAKAVGGKRLDLNHPAKAGTVSLRATLTDADGNTLKQTIQRAYRTVK